MLAQTESFYIALLVTYQDIHGHVYHKELCYFVIDKSNRQIKCDGHNGHG